MFSGKTELATIRNDPFVNGNKQAHLNVVAIFIYEGKDLPALDRNGLSDFFVKFILGDMKHRTRVVPESLTPKWMEQFDLFIYDPSDRELKIEVWDYDRAVRNDFAGETTINLATLENEKLHDMWVNIYKDGLSNGSLHMSIMITGKKILTGDMAELAGAHSEPEVLEAALSRYSLRNTLNDIRDVGILSVKLFKGCGLRAADLNGKSDPFCVLQLVNARFVSQVEYRTLDPEWNRIFTFPVHDLHAVLDIHVMDMDQDKASDFLGRIAVPLLNLHNREQRWYALKDQKLRLPTQGAILLEMELVYNPLRAVHGTVNPKEIRFDDVEQKFDRQIFVRNVTRIRATLQPFVAVAAYIHSCLKWESKARSITVMSLYLLAICFFKLWMVPFAFILIFAGCYIHKQIVHGILGHHSTHHDFENVPDSDDHDVLDENVALLDQNVGTGAKNFVEKIRQAQEQLSNVQNVMGYAADLSERVQNVFRFIVPWLSFVGVIGLFLVMVILYLVPLRLVLFVHGVHKFTKFLRKGDVVENNELLDYLSRAYTDEEVKMYRELRVREIPVTPPFLKNNAAATGGNNQVRRMKRAVSTPVLKKELSDAREKLNLDV